MKLMSWNICCLPRLINPYRNPNNDINKIINLLNNESYDIISLQEVFDRNILNKISDSTNMNCHYLNSYLYNSNGLLTLSKYEILDKKHYVFNNYSGFDSFVNKVIISILIKYIDEFIWIHNTHLQSDALCIKFKNVRDKQIKEFENYLENFKNYKNIIMGDFNIKFENKNINNFQFNEDKLITFPAFNTQFDYIGFDYKINTTYKCDETILSDHNILICEV